jgi:hypothetical protein
MSGAATTRSLARTRTARSVAVLCAAPRARLAVAGIALALARAGGAPCALVGALDGRQIVPRAGSPPARRAAAAVLACGRDAAACGRLVWVADRPGATAAESGVARAAALAAALGRATVLSGMPSAVAIPLARTDALDRVLAWHDALVVVRESAMPEAAFERSLASLAGLGRPLAAMTLPPRLASGLAAAGAVAPAAAVEAVAQLRFDDAGAPRWR